MDLVKVIGGGLGRLIALAATSFVVFVQTETGAATMPTTVVACASALIYNKEDTKYEY